MIIIVFFIVVLLQLLVLSLAVKVGIRLYSKNKDYEEVVNNLGKRIRQQESTISRHQKNISNIQADFNKKLEYFTRKLERQNPPNFIVAGNYLHESTFLLIPSMPEIVTTMQHGPSSSIRANNIDSKKYEKQTIYAAGIFSEHHPISDIKRQLSVHLATYLVDNDFITFKNRRNVYGEIEIDASINYFK